jgi:hypothetical protein
MHSPVRSLTRMTGDEGADSGDWFFHPERRQSPYNLHNLDQQKLNAGADTDPSRVG